MVLASQLIKALKEGAYDNVLEDLYGDAALLNQQRERYEKAVEKYIALYGDEQVEIYSAPGRSEVGGNHTDHQHGKVLAAAVNLDIIAVAAKTEDGIITITSDDLAISPVSVSETEARKEEEGTSMGLVRGVAAGLAQNNCQIGGFRSYMTSQVLQGSGLSSSAAFETVVGSIFSGLYNHMEIDPVLIAKVGQYAENKYFGKPSGLMDQMASSVGSFIKIDFADIDNPQIEKVDVDFGKFGYSLCVVDTKGSHADLTGDYAAISEEMKLVAGFFDKEFLGEVDQEEFYQRLPQVRSREGDRAVLRAIHFFEDNIRVEKEARALQEGDFESFKASITESGNSSFKFLQNVSTYKQPKQQEVALALAVSEKLLDEGKGVCRVHGGGFAGTIQAFVKDEEVQNYKLEMEKIFGAKSCHILKVRRYGGKKVIG